MKRFLLVAIVILSVFFLSYQTEAQSSNQTVVSGSQTTAVNFPAGGCTYNWVNNTPGIGLPASGTGDIASFTAMNTGTMPVTASITATPVTPGYAYVANEGDGTVSVISVATNTVIKTIPVGLSPTFETLSKDGSRLFVVNSQSNTISVINTITNTVVSTITANSSNGIALSPDGNTLYSINSQTSSLTVINVTTNTIITNIPLGDGPADVTTSPDGAWIYVTNSLANNVMVISTTTHAVMAIIPVGIGPEGLVISPNGNFLYVANNYSNTISVINTGTNAVVSTVNVGGDPSFLAISPNGNNVYVTNRYDNTVSVINTATNSVISTLTVGTGPLGISASPNGNFVYITNTISNSVTVVNAASNAVLTTIMVGSEPGSPGNFVTPDASCNGSTINFTITVKPALLTPVITASTATGTISACQGSPSSSLNIQRFTVSGTGLTNDITAAAPTGFEVSLSAGSGYSNRVTIPQSGGKVNNTVVYVRSAASAMGSISGNVVLSSQGASNQNVAVSGTINPLSTVNTIGNQTVNSGSNIPAINFTGTANTFNWVNNKPGIGLPASGTGNIPAFTAINNGNSPVTATITVTPTSSGFAYIANSSSQTVSVVSTATNSVTANVQVGTSPWGVSVSPDGSRVYVVNSGSNSVSVINTSNNTVIATIPVGAYPVDAAVSPDGQRVYVANVYSNSVWVISALNNTVIARINVGRYPEFVSISPDGQNVYVANSSSNTVSVISTVTNTVVSTITVAASPQGMAVSPDGGKLYVASAGGSSNSIAVINTATYAPIASIPVGYGPGSISLTPDGSRLYVANTGQNSVSVINTASNAVISTIPVEAVPMGVSVRPDGILVYVTTGTSNAVSIINTSTNTVTGTIPVGIYPVSLGNFITNGTNCPGASINFTITVNPASVTPAIIATPATGTISACQGSPSASPDVEQFTVSGTGLTNNITATAPTGFEVALSAGGVYSNTVTIPQSGGTANNTIVYVRSAASATGNISGNVTLTSQGANAQNVAVSGKINLLPTVNAIGNQTFVAGNNTTAINFTGTANTFTWTNNNPAIGLPANGTGSIPAFTAVNNGSSPVTATITVTPVPPPTGFAYIANSAAGAGTVSVINVANNSVVATIPTGQSPMGVAISPDGTRVYISNQQSNTISVINTTTNKVVYTITEYQGAEPSGLVLSPDGSKLYVANYNSYTSSGIYVYNTATNALITSIPVDGFPYGLVINNDGSRVYTETQNGVSVINAVTNTVIASIPVGAGDNSYISISPDDSRLYVSNGYMNTVSVIDATTNTIVSVVPVGTQPHSSFVTPDGGKLYVLNTVDNTISIINTSTNAVIKTVAAGGYPTSIGLTPDGGRIYIINGPKSVSVMDVSTYQIVARITVGLGPYSLGNFISGGIRCSGIPKTFTITVKPLSVTPTIIAGSVTGTISACEGSSSVTPHVGQFIVSGTGLTNGIVASAPSGFQLSLSATGAYSNILAIPQSGGVVNNLTVYVGLAASATGNMSGNVTLSSQGASDQNIPVTGKINPLPTVDPVPNQIVVSGSLTSAVHFTGTASNYNWVDSNTSIGIQSGGGPGPDIAPFIAINTANTPVIDKIFVTPVNLATGCSGTTITFTIEVDPLLPPNVTTTGNLSPLSTTYGTASTSTSFSVSGNSMNAGILVTPPAGFEVSTDNTNFSQTVTVGAPGTIAATTVYIRLTSKTPVGAYSGNVTLSSTGITDIDVSIPISIVNPAPLTITGNNVQKRSGETLTNGFVSTGFTSSGLQNNETIGSVFMAYGEGAGADAKAGTYTGSVVPSVASGGSFDPMNYTIVYKAGDIIVTEINPPINIPNAFTPNGDGINDVWNIKSLIDYPSCLVSIFTRYGGLIYQSRGYAKPWDGNYNGSMLPTGTYYYIIDLQNGQPLLSGYVALIR